jgi:hypothetical protein|tara:strand:+ start:542 stop:694 length:153 start_codon:yes stop_codon:yes gene_type:complete
MNYKGQELSDNLTPSQINMYKYYIDQGFTVDQILDMYIEPVLVDEEGDNT